jgi:flagellar biosynthesis/type III secretory pathway chaperone
MTSTQQNPSSDLLRDGIHKAHTLSALLQEELALLTAGDLDSFEALQSRKAEVLESLSALMPTLSGEVPIEDGSDVDAIVALIDDIKEVLATCRDAHLKNAILIDRKIEATRSALEVLRSSRSADTGETYDKLGRIQRGYSRDRQTDV